ncbi:MAG TPA: hypothetical protein VF469_07995 [Kofleriaceae bacterium]
MKKQAGKKLTLSTETLRALTSANELAQVVGGETTAITCGCPTQGCTTAPTCGSPTQGCTTAVICG